MRRKIRKRRAKHEKEFFDPLKNKTVVPIEEIKRYAVFHALKACNGNITEASQKLEISRSTMYRFLEMYNIETQNGLAVIPDVALRTEAAVENVE